jgi:hypothetical protein
MKTGRLSFTTDFSAVKDADVHFVCVGTPQSKDGLAADLTYVKSAVAAIAPHLKDGSLVVGKSTVPVGTAQALRAELAKIAPQADLAWNPEFLREGFAVEDTLTPNRLVVGVANDRAEEILKEVLPLALGFQYAVTLHTRYRRLSSKVALELSADRASHDFKFFANRLNYSIFKNAYKRDPENNRLLIVPCLDGMTFAANSGKTLHYHVGIGNVPETITIDLLEALVMKAWSKVQSARKNINVKSYKYKRPFIIYQ